MLGVGILSLVASVITLIGSSSEEQWNWFAFGVVLLLISIGLLTFFVRSTRDG